jgi:hypothetical protein
MDCSSVNVALLDQEYFFSTSLSDLIYRIISVGGNKKLHHEKMELLSANNVRDQKFIQIW